VLIVFFVGLLLEGIALYQQGGSMDMKVICVLVREQDKIMDFAEECFRYSRRVAWTDHAVFLEWPSTAEFFKQK
jgi:hypothetical protein